MKLNFTAFLALVMFFASSASASVLTLNYFTTDVGGGQFQYDFELVVTNDDSTYAVGHGFNWIIFGDNFSAPSLLTGYSPVSDSFPNPNMNYTTSSGGHNGPTYLDTVDVGTNGWIPTGVGDSVTWSGTANVNITSGLQFSTLIPINGATASNFQLANYIAVPEPGTLSILGIGLGLTGIGRRRIRNAA